MTKPTIVSRASLGRPLTYTELDANFTNLRDAVFQVEGLNDDSTGGLFTVEQGGDFTLRGGANVTIAVDSGNRIITINTSGAAASDLVNDTSPQLGGDLDVNGRAIVSVSNGNIALTPNGTGQIQLNKNIKVANAAAFISDANIFFYGGGSYPGNVAAAANTQAGFVANVFITGDGFTKAVYTSNGSQDLELNTNSGTNSGKITITKGLNGDIIIDPDGTGSIEVKGPLKTNTTSGTPTTYQNGYYENMLVTPVTWLKINVGGTDYYLPLFT